ncbi:enoyl-CoA hydratase/isomerase family protein [Ramlibacter sp. USB13]|uniref:Enoyl-CoA hydratase/isomerase family protein n=1 Tax=Ramlibacter cellulosilyticus TaxID=2764187 RepID=A0A923MQC4_9BURK|nr:enoyl-CoA hydratase/isomerase family protein [Ramlibacter cellulosilyticus]MBC5782941.1 enoyl-CoA hydratase/isomerase family protein [Ramlibacter cellulosilyticus]
MTTNPELGVERRDGVLWLTIRREERRNALSPGVLEALSVALAEAQADRSVRAVVLTGAGEKAFCAGADLQSGQSFAFDFSEPTGAFARLLRQARASHVPLVARVNGACMAGGMGLLAMCDLAVAAPHATFGLPEVKVGLFPAQVLAVLQHLLPRRHLAELCLTGEPVDSAQALAMGLVNHVDADLDGRVDGLLRRLMDKSPAAIRRGLYTLKSIETMAFEEAMAFTESQIALFAQTEDAREGQAAFREKRAPQWKGR